MVSAAVNTQPASSKPTSGVFLGLQVKLILAFTLVVTLVFGGAFYWFYLYSSSVALNRVHTDLETTLTSALKGINGDEFELLGKQVTLDAVAAATKANFPYPDKTAVPLYWKHVDWLLQVHNIEPRAFLYSYVAVNGDPNNLVFIGSHGAPINPPEGAPYLSPFPILDGKQNISGLTVTSFVSEPYSDPYGTWISAFTPIKNSQGKIVGVLGTDYQAEYVTEIRSQVVRTIIPVFIASYLIVLVLVLLVARAVTRPTVRLTHAAEKIAEGDYDQDFSDLTRSRFRDEIGTLAGVFTVMVNKVHQREQSLRRQVDELQIMVDEGKRHEQVKEIVDNDFFRDLTAKAKAMRAARTASESRAKPRKKSGESKAGK